MGQYVPYIGMILVLAVMFKVLTIMSNKTSGSVLIDLAMGWWAALSFLGVFILKKILRVIK
jgi:hypothetical protein